MKGLIRGCLALLGIGSLAGFASATGPVDFTALPVFSGGVVTYPFPIRIKLVNAGEEASGVLKVGGKNEAVLYPFNLAAKEKKSFIVYSPIDDESDPSRGSSSVSIPTVAVSLEATSQRSGGSESNQKISLSATMPYDLLLISNRFNKLSFLATEDKPKTKGSASPVDGDRQSRGAINACRINVPDALDRAAIYKRFTYILLGYGTKDLTDANVEALKEYAASGGSLVFSPSEGSSRKDPRWAKLIPASGKTTYLGLGSICSLSFDPELVTRGVPEYRHRFRMETGSILERASASALRSDASNAVAVGDTKYSGADPFKVKLPSFSSVALALFGYFVLVVPLNVFVLKKLQRPELMWITAPICAVAFASLIFKTSSTLGDTPMSMSAHGGIISVPEAKTDQVYGVFALFLPKAATLDFNLKGVQILDPFNPEDPRAVLGRSVAIDSGTSLNIPNYRSSNLQFAQFSDFEEHPRDRQDQFSVRFSVGKPEEGIYPVTATNVGTSTSTDATFIAGLYKTEGRTIEPGASVKLMVDHVTPAPMSQFTEFQQASNNPSPGDFHQMSNSERAETLCQVRGQVALFGVVEGYRLGPNLGSKCQYRAAAVGAAFAPVDLRLP